MPDAADGVRERIEGVGYSVFPRGDQKTDDGFFAERLGGLQTMQALDQDKARAIRSHQDRRLLAVVEHTGGDFIDALLFERSAPFYRHVDVGDCESLALHHEPGDLRSMRADCRHETADRGCQSFNIGI
jgi:hypothetical protein